MTNKFYFCEAPCRRRIRVRILDMVGKLENVPIDKTYQNNGRRYIDGRFEDNQVYLKLEIEEKGFTQQRLHSLYYSSKKGYYCMVCHRKCYFDKEDILKLNK